MECVIVAAGRGERAQLGYNKVLSKINNQEIILHTIDVFLRSDIKVILVVAKEDFTYMKNIVPLQVKIVLGGKTRQESVYKGLLAVTDEYCLIHDGARPLVTLENIGDLVNLLKEYDAVFLAGEVTDAIKENNEGIIKTLNRDDYLLAQTPQGFKTNKIITAYKYAKTDFLDDISVYQNYYDTEKIGYIINNTPNFKLTYDKDLKILERIMPNMNIRIGHSFDIHQLTENKKLMLGGIEIPYEKGLLGHSDADCLLHAIAESIIGALGLGDLGTFFPDDDQKYQGIASSILLLKIAQILAENEYKIINIDTTIYLEAPKMKPYMATIRKNIAEILKIDPQTINVKATTYEKLDAIGNNEAIAAEAVVLIGKKGIL